MAAFSHPTTFPSRRGRDTSPFEPGPELQDSQPTDEEPLKHFARNTQLHLPGVLSTQITQIRGIFHPPQGLSSLPFPSFQPALNPLSGSCSPTSAPCSSPRHRRHLRGCVCPGGTEMDVTDTKWGSHCDRHGPARAPTFRPFSDFLFHPQPTRSVRDGMSTKVHTSEGRS